MGRTNGLQYSLMPLRGWHLEEVELLTYSPDGDNSSYSSFHTTVVSVGSRGALYQTEQSKRLMLRNIRLDHLSVCLSVREVYCGKTAEWIRMPFGVVSAWGRSRNGCRPSLL